MRTAPDMLCNGNDVYTTDMDNAILIEPLAFNDWYGSDAHAGDLILAAALAHEYVHCATLEDTQLATGGWTNECDYYRNEIAGSIVELDIINCLLANGCAGEISVDGLADITARASVVQAYETENLDAYMAANC